MAERQVSDKQLIEALLRERDELYRRATKAEHRLECVFRRYPFTNSGDIRSLGL